MAWIEMSLNSFYLLTSTLFCCVLCSEVVVEYSEDRKPCTYFENTRCAEPAAGLVNCSWYSHNSCCKRTEVTSVFSSNMLPLYRALRDCQNKMNYMMCFFCSPDQYHWYKEGKVHICEKFCTSLYDSCKDAFYHGTKIGEKYRNGTAFCQAQNFQVVNSKYCFKYDSTVFDAAFHTQPSILLVFFSAFVAAVVFLCDSSACRQY